MSTSNTGMIAAIVRYFTKVEQSLISIYFNDGVTLAPGAVHEVDLKTILTEHAEYHLQSADVLVRMLDGETGSVTQGWLINAEAVITVAINNTGVVRVINKSADPAIVTIKINKPTVKK